MIQPKKEKKTTEEKKVNRPDIPLAATSEPVGMQQERNRQLIESVKGSSLKLMQESRAKKAAEKAVKEVDSKRGMDVISRNQQY